MSKKAPRNFDLPALNPLMHHATWPDMLGKDFKAGDIIVAGVTAGQCGSLTIGMVRAIRSCDSKGKQYEQSRYKRGTGYTTIPSASIAFCPLVDSGNRYSRWTNRDSRISPDRVLRLDFTLEEFLAQHPEILEDHDDLD